MAQPAEETVDCFQSLWRRQVSSGGYGDRSLAQFDSAGCGNRSFAHPAEETVDCFHIVYGDGKLPQEVVETTVWPSLAQSAVETAVLLTQLRSWFSQQARVFTAFLSQATPLPRTTGRVLLLTPFLHSPYAPHLPKKHRAITKY